MSFVFEKNSTWTDLVVDDPATEVTFHAQHPTFYYSNDLKDVIEQVNPWSRQAERGLLMALRFSYENGTTECVSATLPNEWSLEIQRLAVLGLLDILINN